MTPEEKNTYYKWWRLENPGKTAKASREYRARNPNRALVQSAKHRAKKRGLEFTIGYEDVVVPKCCPVLGIPIVVNVGEKKMKDNSPTLDRIDNKLGYVPGNVIVVAWKVNRVKNDASVEELRKIADFYEANQW